MFTGIVQEIGLVTSKRTNKGIVRLMIRAPKIAAKVEPLESVCVNGTCLTVVTKRSPTLTFEIIEETQSLTTLSRLKQGDAVNLEPSLSMTDRFNGHVVLGHVDGIGSVRRLSQKAGERILEIEVPKPLRKYLVRKGPITVEGVSLTVGCHVTLKTFTIHLIPETLRRTTLENLKKGDSVNLELDYFAKLLWEFQKRT